MAEEAQAGLAEGGLECVSIDPTLVSVANLSSGEGARA